MADLPRCLSGVRPVGAARSVEATEGPAGWGEVIGGAEIEAGAGLNPLETAVYGGRGCSCAGRVPRRPVGHDEALDSRAESGPGRRADRAHKSRQALVKGRE